MESLLSLGSDTHHVHPRLRKHLSRCTLDCGFKTSESPALRGFVVGLRALATAALYLVLKSNGLHCPKIRLKKFGFSSKSIPANIVQKLPSQLCSKPLFIPVFNFSHKRPTLAFTGKVGTHSPFGKRSHTAAYTPKQGPSLSRPQCGLCCQRNFFYSATLLYTYISRFFVNPQHQQMRKIWQSCCHKFYPQTAFHRVFQLLAQMAHVCFHE